MNILDPNYHRKSILKEIGRYVAGIFLLVGLFIAILIIIAYVGAISGYENLNSPTMQNYSYSVQFMEHHDHRIDEWS